MELSAETKLTCISSICGTSLTGKILPNKLMIAYNMKYFELVLSTKFQTLMVLSKLLVINVSLSMKSQ